MMSVSEAAEMVRNAVERRCYCAANDLGIACNPKVGPCQQMGVLIGPDRARADRLRAQIDLLALDDHDTPAEGQKGEPS